MAASPPTDEQARALVDAAAACSWLPEPQATGLPLIARNLHEGSAHIDLPSAQTIAALRHNHGPDVDEALAAWVRLARPDATVLGEAVAEALSDTSPAPAVLASLQEATSRFTAAERGSLLRLILEDPAAPALSAEAIAAVRGTLPDREVANILAERYDRATSNPQRRHVLDLWERAAITGEIARRHLIDRVLMPLFGLNNEGKNSGAADLGLDYLSRLARPLPSGVKHPLGKQIVDATQPYGLRSKAEAAMLATGYTRRSKSWQFWRDDIDLG